jgi:hypothetical protein
LYQEILIQDGGRIHAVNTISGLLVTVKKPEFSNLYGVGIILDSIKIFRWIGSCMLLVLPTACGSPSGNLGNDSIPAFQSTETPLNLTSTLLANEIPLKTTDESPSNDFQVSPTPCEINVDFNSLVLTEVGTNTNSCLPEQTDEGIGIYIFDIENQKELVSINSDIPFQFGSSFKSPLLVYFLSNCKQYWDISSSVWQDFFLIQDGINIDPWYSSPEYEQIIKDYLSDVNHWGEIKNFAEQNLIQFADKVTSLDQRYDILEQAYRMVTESNNIAAGNILNFVFENCKSQEIHETVLNCGGSNPITEFNYWFNAFSNIDYKDNETRRGLHSWDTITIVDGNGIKSETRMPTYALKDACALQGAFIGCSTTDYVNNSWTARDLAGFYQSLFNIDDLTVKETAFKILKVDKEGNSRGLLKNLSRKLESVSISKNGFDGYTLVDAGILEYHEKNFIVVTMSYSALKSMNMLYGQYNLSGEPTGEMEGLIEQILLQEINFCTN